MNADALGMVETKGLVGVTKAVDVVIEAASVPLIRCEKIGSGFVTVMVRGDIGVAKVATDAGVASTATVGGAVSIHVIPCPHTDVEKVLPYLGQRQQIRILTRQWLQGGAPLSVGQRHSLKRGEGTECQ